MEKCFMSREKLFVKILLEKKELNIITASENLREKKHYFDTFEHPCRGIPLINVEKWILTFFSRDVALYRFISGFPRRGQTY